MDKTGNYYVSLPRWRKNVPATFGKVVFGDDGHFLVSPYPNWETNRLGNPDNLVSVLGFEIDSNNILWILDQGKYEGKAAAPSHSSQ